MPCCGSGGRAAREAVVKSEKPKVRCSKCGASAAIEQRFSKKSLRYVRVVKCLSRECGEEVLA